jgi:predicted dehydrogenase
MFDAWKERQRQRLKNRPERTVFYNIFATMMLVLAVELLMAVASILAVNVTGQLDENAKDLLTMRVRNRASYVQEILRNAEDLEQLSEQITATTQQLLKSGDISLDTLDNSSEQSDALLVVTPHKTHPALVMQAFAHGKHVLCDKPSANALAPALEMNRAAEKSGLVFAMMFHQRRYKKYMRLKKLLDDGALGEIKRVQLENSRYFRTWMYHRSGSWRSSWAGEGGGALLNQGQHILDIWQWLFGMPNSIYAAIPYGKYNDFMVDDEATLLMEYPQQRTATFILSTGEGSYTERLEIVGTKGTALLEEDTLTLRTYAPDTETYRRTADCTERQQLTETTTTEQFAPQAEPYPEMLANFADAILHGTPLTAPGVEGVRALELTDAAYLSAWLGEKITLPLDAERFEQELQKHIQEEQANG